MVAKVIVLGSDGGPRSEPCGRTENSGRHWMKTLCQRRSQIREQQVGTERMLFDEASDAVHVLNGSAVFIWDCLKAPVTTAQIESMLRDEYDLSTVADVPAMIAGVLDDFRKKKLIEPAPLRGPSDPMPRAVAT